MRWFLPCVCIAIFLLGGNLLAQTNLNDLLERQKSLDGQVNQIRELLVKFEGKELSDSEKRDRDDLTLKLKSLTDEKARMDEKVNVQQAAALLGSSPTPVPAVTPAPINVENVTGPAASGPLTRSDLMKMEKSPFAALPEEQIEQLLLQHPISQVKSLMHSFPKLRRVAVLICKDETALPKLFKITQNTKKIQMAGMGSLIVFFIFFLIKMVSKKNTPFLVRFIKRMFYSLLFMGLNIAIFYLVFTDELKPTVTIFLKVFKG